MFLAVWRTAATYNATLGSPVGWLVRLARNRAIDHFRTSGVRAPTLENLEAPPIGDNPEQAASRNQERSRVVVPASIAIAVTALYWTVERLAL